MHQRVKGYQQEATVGGQTVLVETREFENGELGEIQIKAPKVAPLTSEFLTCFNRAVSIGLRFGIPLDEFVEEFVFTRFPPDGKVEGNSVIKMASSIPDYVFRELAVAYLGRNDLAHIKPDELGLNGKDIFEKQFDEETSEEELTIKNKFWKNRQSLAISTASIIDVISNQVDDLKSTMPNDEAGQKTQNELIEFLQEVMVMLESLLAQIEMALSSQQNSSSREAVNAVIDLKHKVSNWLNNNSDLVDTSIRMSIAATFLNFFSNAGANMSISTPALLAIFGGGKVVEIIKRLNNNNDE
ncbi:hypothetical protein [Terasakiella sp.]|uniref:TSCPD domain-containing protein n=1 Tax=Terasakiella sp. TaxID=2034861 RepID=UPI003AA97866